jgi:dTDP-4-dehydrorhamnose reductase
VNRVAALPTRVLVTGGAGTVARAFVLGAPVGVELAVTVRRTEAAPEVRRRATSHAVELTDQDAVLALLLAWRPDVVLHTAYTMGDRADIVDATATVARATATTGAALVHLSTDVVFAGDSPPYREVDTPDPISDYGLLKAEAEAEAVAAVPDVCITRTSIVVGLDPPDPGTAALLDALRGGHDVTLFADEFRQPLRVDDLAAELWAIVALPRPDRAGAWHLPGPEHLSRLELGRRLAAAAGLHPDRIGSASAAAHPTPRPRDPRLVAERRRSLGVPIRPVGD